MDGERTTGLLSEKEREQLLNRSEHDRQAISKNDLKVKKKLKTWLEEIEDIRLILRYLPEDQTRDVLIDHHPFDLLSIAADLMRIKQFLSISGRMDEPEEWQARGYGIIRLAEEKDICRSLILNSHLRYLSVFAGEQYTGKQNPAVRARELDRSMEGPKLSGEIAPGELKAMERVRNAMARYAKLQRFNEIISGDLSR